MKQPSPGAAGPPESLEALIAGLQARGYRMTTPRRLVLEVLFQPAEHAHYSCSAVTQALQERGVSLDAVTVYRILQWLKDVDVVAQTDLGEGYDVYSLVARRHHHLICLKCRQTIEVDDAIFDPLREVLLKQYDFLPRLDHFAIFGLCARCREAEAPGES